MSNDYRRSEQPKEPSTFDERLDEIVDSVLIIHVKDKDYVKQNKLDTRKKMKQAIRTLILEEVEPYKKMLEKLGTEKCPHCKDYMIDDDMNICESCNYGVHEWCTGYTYDGDGEYPAESAYAICKDCFDKSEQRKKVLGE